MMTQSPQIAAILNITPNHLDRHITMEAYTAAKARILRYQNSDDVAILGSIRDRLASDGKVIGSTSVTWIVVHDGESWKINQIQFNDSRLDPSIVAQVFLGQNED